MASRPWTEPEVRRILTCMVAFSGNAKATVEHLQERDDIKRVPTAWRLINWTKWEHRDLYNQLRDQGVEQAERELADRYRGVAMQAVEATELGVKVAKERLEKGDDIDPARSAANLATVADKTLRNYSLLEGKPTAIREDRTLPEAMRALIDMGVIVPHTPAAEIEEAKVEDEPEDE